MYRRGLIASSGVDPPTYTPPPPPVSNSSVREGSLVDGLQVRAVVNENHRFDAHSIHSSIHQWQHNPLLTSQSTELSIDEKLPKLVSNLKLLLPPFLLRCYTD